MPPGTGLWSGRLIAANSDELAAINPQIRVLKKHSTDVLLVIANSLYGAGELAVPELSDDFIARFDVVAVTNNSAL